MSIADIIPTNVRKLINQWNITRAYHSANKNYNVMFVQISDHQVFYKPSRFTKRERSNNGCGYVLKEFYFKI